MGLPQRYDAAEAERRWQSIWAENHLYEFDPNDPRPIFAIDTPPPTVSGDLHIGHVYSYVQAEAMARFWRMQGYNLYYPFGFDDNGLPNRALCRKAAQYAPAISAAPILSRTYLEVSREIRTALRSSGSIWASASIGGCATRQSTRSRGARRNGRSSICIAKG